jgi:hypothetical protein
MGLLVDRKVNRIINHEVIVGVPLLGATGTNETRHSNPLALQSLGEHAKALQVDNSPGIVWRRPRRDH